MAGTVCEALSFETELAEACAPSHYNIGLLSWTPLGMAVQVDPLNPR